MGNIMWKGDTSHWPDVLHGYLYEDSDTAFASFPKGAKGAHLLPYKKAVGFEGGFLVVCNPDTFEKFAAFLYSPDMNLELNATGIQPLILGMK